MSKASLKGNAMKKVLIITAAFAVAVLARAAIQPIEGTNVVGFTDIAAPSGANTIITVPFEACMSNGGAGMLSDMVATYSLTANADAALADQLIVLTTNGAEQVYYYYYNHPATGWTAINTEVIVTNGQSRVITPPAANAFEIARGLGFWIKRVASADSTVYVQGQVTSSKQATLIATGLNLVGYGSLQSFDINAIAWTGAFGTNNLSSLYSDRIMVGKGDGTYTTYYYFVKRAGAPSSSYYDQFTNKWVLSTASGPALPSRNVPAGQGFWYHRRGPGPFTFRPDGE